jgi:hypothetical protein
VLFNDAGIGKDRAGVTGIYLLSRYGIYAAAVDAFSAEIGLAEETLGGRISHSNEHARAIGVFPGMKGSTAANLISHAPRISPNESGGVELVPAKILISVAPSGHRMLAVDSNSMIDSDCEQDIIFTGSHGGLVGSKAATPNPVLAVFYNDAGVGKNDAGISRLPWLERRGVPAATVSAASARIGFGLDTYNCGIISHANSPAADWGISPGIRAAEAAQLILERAALLSPQTVQTGKEAIT